MRKKQHNKNSGSKPVSVNDDIVSYKVQVICNGNNIGVLNTSEAKSLAKSKNLDLVEIDPNSKPPVCLIVDYDKYRYNKQKKIKKQSKKSDKEIKLSPVIDKHDLETKISKLNKFLKDGHSVLVSVFFKGRQNAHTDEGRKVLSKVMESVEDVGKMDSKPNLQGKRMSVKISPK